MTLQTSLIVISSVFAERLMRVVTRDTAYVSIVRITLAVKNPVRLKAHVVDLHTVQQRELFGATMTCGAKVLRQFIATKQSGIVNRLCRRVACFDSRDVLSAWTMTSFATYAVRKLVEQLKQHAPVKLVVVPSAGHFFENSLDQLKNEITEWVTGNRDS